MQLMVGLDRAQRAKDDRGTASSASDAGERVPDRPRFTLLELQSLVGNRAVSRLVARQGVRSLARGPAPAKKTRLKVLRITVFPEVSVGLVIFELEQNRTLALGLTHNGMPKPGLYTVTYDDARHRLVGPTMAGMADAAGFVVKWTAPPGTILTYRSPLILEVKAGAPGSGGSGDGGAGGGGSSGNVGASGAGGGSATSGASGAGGSGTSSGAGGGGVEKGADGAGGTGSSGTGVAGEGKTASGGSGPSSDPAAKGGDVAGTSGGDPAAHRMTPREEALWRELYLKMIGGPTGQVDDPTEQIRLYEILRSKVEDPSFSKTRTPWTEFARFLDANKDKIEGIIRSGQAGKLTEEKIEQIIAEYGKFVAVRAAKEEGRTELTTLKDFEKEFEYDPGWAQLSAADRKLLLEYARQTPDRLGHEKIDFPRVTTSMKVNMALKLSWKSWPEEIAEAAKEAFTDPTFLVTLVVMMGIYVGLWLVPDPSMITKILAGTLTVGLLLQFGYEDLYKFAKAWSELNDACGAAQELTAIEAAGDKFAKKVGQVGFDIILMIVMHRIGKRLGPRVQKIGAERLVTSAKAELASVEAQPGSGVEAKAPAGTPNILEAARAKAAPTPAAILDVLANELPEASREPLKRFRAKAGDSNALKALDGQQARGADIARFLQEQSMTKAAKDVVRLRVLRRRRGSLARNSSRSTPSRIRPSARRLAPGYSTSSRTRWPSSGFSTIRPSGRPLRPATSRMCSQRSARRSSAPS